MKLRDTYSGDIYDVLTLEDVDTSPNPDVEGEVIVQMVSPAGEPVEMSVDPNQNIVILVDEDGQRKLAPLFPGDQYEEVDNG